MQKRGIYSKNLIHCSNQKHTRQDLLCIPFEKRWLQVSMSKFNETKIRENNEKIRRNLTHFQTKKTYFQSFYIHFHMPNCGSQFRSTRYLIQLWCFTWNSSWTRILCRNVSLENNSQIIYLQWRRGLSPVQSSENYKRFKNSINCKLYCK